MTAVECTLRQSRRSQSECRNCLQCPHTHSLPPLEAIVTESFHSFPTHDCGGVVPEWLKKKEKVSLQVNNKIILLEIHQNFYARRFDENVNRLQIGFLKILHTFDVNVQQTNLFLFVDIFHRFFAGSINISGKFGVFDEISICDCFQNFFPFDEIIIFAMDFSISWLSSRVRNGKSETIFKFSHQFLEQSALATARRSTKYEWSHRFVRKRRQLLLDDFLMLILLPLLIIFGRHCARLRLVFNVWLGLFDRQRRNVQIRIWTDRSDVEWWIWLDNTVCHELFERTTIFCWHKLSRIGRRIHYQAGRSKSGGQIVQVGGGVVWWKVGLWWCRTITAIDRTASVGVLTAFDQIALNFVQFKALLLKIDCLQFVAILNHFDQFCVLRNRQQKTTMTTKKTERDSLKIIVLESMCVSVRG